MAKMTFKELLYLINSDAYRYEGKVTFKKFFKFMFLNKGFKISLLYRICMYFKKNNNKTFYYFFKFILMHTCRRYTIDISTDNDLGPGLYMNHQFAIVIGKIKTGENLNVSHGVTLGRMQRGKKKGSPTIGNNVFIGPGASVLGNIKIGNNIAIAAGSVVLDDIPDNVVIAGNPAKIISDRGSEGLMSNMDY